MHKILSRILTLALFALFITGLSAEEPHVLKQVVAVENVCAWPNLTLLPDGTIIAVFHNQPSHGQQEGDIDCWASPDGIQWEKRSTVTEHEPNTVRMNHAAGLAKNGDLIVLCSGWSNLKQPERPKQAAFRDAILRSWVLRSSDGGRSWTKSEDFPAAEAGWSEYIPFGDIWVGADGALHVSCYQGQFKDPSQSTKTKGWKSSHLKSKDDGRTWSVVSVIGPSHNETDLFYLGEKNWLAAARIDKMELIRSNDNGVTWQKPQPVTGRNEINGHLTRLKDGRLLLSYGIRVNGRRGVSAKLSSDEGQTWSEPIRISHTADGGDCGYPSSIQKENGEIVTAWYSSKSPQHTGYHLGVTVWKVPERGSN
ncbi:sialidase family protein [Gimesia maris]|uniref:sialidase family protein n=1 Tax=Gimesia maris TaxID=122 RepID=UPI0030DB2A60